MPVGFTSIPEEFVRIPIGFAKASVVFKTRVSIPGNPRTKNPEIWQISGFFVYWDRGSDVPGIPGT